MCVCVTHEQLYSIQLCSTVVSVKIFRLLSFSIRHIEYWLVEKPIRINMFENAATKTEIVR